ncbi:MAG: HAMP domain-containing protein [Rhizobacter sp.]|nr:HAMP domain-containing protein [Chlorobiales bacterium]
MADSLGSTFSQSSVRGKLMRDFIIAVGSPILIMGLLLIFVFYFFGRNQSEKASLDIERQAQSRVAEQSKILENVRDQALINLQSQVASEFSRSDYVQSISDLSELVGGNSEVYQKQLQGGTIPVSTVKGVKLKPEEIAGQVKDLRARLYGDLFLSMGSMQLSMLTVLDTTGRVLMRGTTQDRWGDDVFIKDYTRSPKTVALMEKLVTSAVNGKVTTSLELYPADVLRAEPINEANVISGVTVISQQTLADQAKVDVSNAGGGGEAETRGLMLSTVQPIRGKDNLIVGCVVAAKMLNRNEKLLLKDYQAVIPEEVSKAFFTIENLRVLSSEKLPNGSLSIGYKIPEDFWQKTLTQSSLYTKGENTGVTPKAYAQYSVMKNSMQRPIGVATVATEYSYYGNIIAGQQKNASTLIFYTIGIVVAALVLGVLGGYIFARRQATKITGSLDEIKSLMESVLAGDFNARSNIVSGDEFEDLSVRFNEMIRRLSALIETETERDAMQKQLTDLLIVVSNSAEGDFTQRASVTEGALGALADSFNLMVDDLGSLIREVQSVAISVGEASTEILSSTEQMSRGAEEQSVQVANASAAVEEMAASIRQVAMNADSASEAAQRAVQVAQTGGNTVLETIEGMRRIRATVQDSAQKIKSLGESSLEISKIVQTIEDIANQTNLLALNATIEAARAGDAGRGFAVVADQVRELAERSSKATNDISQLVQTIQSETQDAVSAMERGTLEVERGTKLADSASRALDEIRSVVQQSTELIQEISLAAKQQDIASSGVVSAMNEVSQIAKQSLSGSKQSASLATKLNDITQQLARSVSRFKIPTGIFTPATRFGDSASSPQIGTQSKTPLLSQGNELPPLQTADDLFSDESSADNGDSNGFGNGFSGNGASLGGNGKKSDATKKDKDDAEINFGGDDFDITLN